jgi:hypothetical protein
VPAELQDHLGIILAVSSGALVAIAGIITLWIRKSR